MSIQGQVPGVQRVNGPTFSVTSSTSSSGGGGSTPPPSPSATPSALGTVSPTSVPFGGTLDLSGLTINAGASTWWRLQLSVQDVRNGQTVATFPSMKLQGPQEIQITSSPIQGSGLTAGDGLKIVGTLTLAADEALTQQVSTKSLATGTVATVVAVSSSGSGSGGTSTQSTACDALWSQYNSLYQQQLQLRLQAADNYPSGNLPASLADEIQTLATQMDAIEIQYGQQGCTVTLPG